MIIQTIFISVALNLSSLNFQELESYFWDCDAMFMKGELKGQDMMTCLSITEQFQKHFWDKWVFNQYWNAQKKQQWLKRGYVHHDEHDD